MHVPTAAICLTGSELTRGETRDLNGSFLGRELTSLGISVTEIRLVPDDPQELRSCYREMIARQDILVSSGGLGPTADDLTIELLAEALGRNVVRDAEAERRMVERVRRRGRQTTDLPENFFRQAEVIEACQVLQNPVGLAPGSLVETDRGFVVALPGVPRELEGMFRECVVPEILRRFDLSPPRIVRAKLIDVPESWAEARIQKSGVLVDGIEYGISAKLGELLLKFIVRDPTRRHLLDSVHDRLEAEFGSDLVRLPEGLIDASGDAQDTSLGQVVHSLLLETDLRVATAESCTGGLIAKELTERAGSSAWFVGSAVCYANEAKVAVLGVREESLARHGAVSEEICREMALGALRVFGCDRALSTTGIAGPGGGSEAKPRGLVYIGLARREDAGALAEVERRVFSGSRERVRQQSTVRALDLLRRSLLKD